MSAIILDGKEIAKKVLKSVKIQGSAVAKTLGRPVSMVIVSIDPTYESKTYIKSKLKKAESLGFIANNLELKSDISQLDLENKIKALSDDANIDGILIQLPIPNRLDSGKAIEKIDPKKDLDGLCSHNQHALVSGLAVLIPCTPLGILKLIQEARVQLGSDNNLSGLHAVVIGRSSLVGRPIAQLLLAQNCTVTICHSKTTDIQEHCSKADIIVSATGKPGLIKTAKKGSIVIDVGITYQNDTLLGDVDFEHVKELCAAITPVPGGVGPMTVAMLMENLVNAAKLRF